MENQDQSQEQKTTQENKLLSPILNSNINKAGERKCKKRHATKAFHLQHIR